MQPSSEGSRRGSSRQLKRYGPIVGVLAVIAVVAVLLTVGGSGDDEEPEAQDTQAAPVDIGPDDDVVPYSYALEEGFADEIEWGDNCDTDAGRLEIPTTLGVDCFKPFDGDNGGETEQGVTAETIDVVFYQSNPSDLLLQALFDLIGNDDTNEQILATIHNYINMYEALYETYGRKVNLITFEGTGTATDEVSAVADAETIARDYAPFAVVGGPLLNAAFAETLAQNGIMCIACNPGRPDSWYVERDPYVYGVALSSSQTREHVAEYVCKRLAGDPAIHAGDEDFHDDERVFGLITTETGPESAEMNELFVGLLEDCGVDLAEVLTYTDATTDLPNTVTGMVSKLKDSDVTSVIFIGDPVAPQLITTTATEQEYFPEWILTGSALVDTTAFARTYDQEQWAHAFGPSALWARQPIEEEGSYFLHEWFCGFPPPADETSGVIIAPVALAYNVLQGVGPELTYQRWRDVLFNAPPIESTVVSPYVSFGDRGLWDTTDFNAADDMTEVWWDAEATGPDERGQEGKGMYAYVDGGARYLPGEWPETDPKVFDDEGAVLIYEEPPEGLELPDYEPPEHEECERA